MTSNENFARSVRVSNQDLAIGDIIVGADGEYIGVIASVPLIYQGEGRDRVTYDLDNGEGEIRQVDRWHAGNQYIEIPRRMR